MLILFSIFAAIKAPPTVRYSSVVQLKNKYSKNRLCVTSETNGPQFELPSIYSTHPPFDDGWTWIVESELDDLEFARKPVKCGSNITLMNPVSSYYLSTRKHGNSGVEVVPSSHVQGKQSVWSVICDRGENWIRDQSIQLRNAEFGCYLTTSLEMRTKELVNKYNVTCAKLTADAIWKAAEGVYFLDNENNDDENEFGSDKEL